VYRGKVFFLLLFFTVSFNLFSQQVSIHANAMPLNEVLVELASSYDIQISFDDRSLSHYKITLSGTFDSPEAALRKLMAGFPLELEKNGDVFIIVPTRKPEKKKSFNISGQVNERGSGEPLPYSNVIINGYGMATDLNGTFAYLSSTDSIFTVKVSHLGYYILDTNVAGPAELQFQLTPSIIKLSEIEIRNKLVERSTLIGDQPGMMKLNHQIAYFYRVSATTPFSIF